MEVGWGSSMHVGWVATTSGAEQGCGGAGPPGAEPRGAPGPYSEAHESLWPCPEALGHKVRVECVTWGHWGRQPLPLSLEQRIRLAEWLWSLVRS